jgi:hypothetical protein
MVNLVLRDLIAVSSVTCIACSVAVVVIALSGKPIRVEYNTSTTQWVAEINGNGTSLPPTPNYSDREVLIAFL